MNTRWRYIIFHHYNDFKLSRKDSVSMMKGSILNGFERPDCLMPYRFILVHGMSPFELSKWFKKMTFLLLLPQKSYLACSSAELVEYIFDYLFI